MRLLFDTHIVLEVVRSGLLGRASKYQTLLTQAEVVFVSVATLWEISIKAGIGKLDPGMPVSSLADYLASAGFTILDIDRNHAVTLVDPEPATRDPFDRMLLAQCKVERLQLVTFDRALVSHPLAYPGPI